VVHARLLRILGVDGTGVDAQYGRAALVLVLMLALIRMALALTLACEGMIADAEPGDT
jgi:hypothetical protein